MQALVLEQRLHEERARLVHLGDEREERLLFLPEVLRPIARTSRAAVLDS